MTVLPMHCVLLSWDPERGLIIGNRYVPIGAFAHTGDMQKDAEAFAAICRYMQSVSQAHEPHPKELPATHSLPSYTETQLACAQRFTVAGVARGSGISPQRPTVSRESFLDALDEMEIE